MISYADLSFRGNNDLITSKVELGNQNRRLPDGDSRDDNNDDGYLSSTSDSGEFIPDQPVDTAPLKTLGIAILVCIAIFAISGLFSDSAPLTDYYKVIGVESTDTADTINVAVKQAQLIWHPDRCKQTIAEQDRCTRTFRKVAKARKVLLNPDKRLRYDRERRRRGEQRAHWSEWAGAAAILSGFAWIFCDPFGDKMNKNDNDRLSQKVATRREAHSASLVIQRIMLSKCASDHTRRQAQRRRIIRQNVADDMEARAQDAAKRIELQKQNKGQLGNLLLRLAIVSVCVSIVTQVLLPWFGGEMEDEERDVWEQQD